MHENTTLMNVCSLHLDWRKLRHVASEQLFQTRELLTKIDANPATDTAAKQEIESLAAQLQGIDSAFVPVAKAFNKKITILGTQPTWSTMKVRNFCSDEFMYELLQQSL